MTLTLASQIIGFISFSITLLTLLGVYRDAISTIRHAPTQIPLMLGNLRAEIATEKAFIRVRLSEGDRFNVFPWANDDNNNNNTSTKRRRRRRESQQQQQRRLAFTQLLDATMRDLWTEFKNLERPFLIRSPTRAEEVAKGDYWGDSDVEDYNNKRASYPRSTIATDRRGRSKELEGGYAAFEKDYYRTDLTHRFIWWQSRGQVDSLLDQVQRVQIRRIERDVFETDQLVKRLVDWTDSNRDGGRGGKSRGRSGGSGGSSSGGGESRVRRRRGGGGGGGGGFQRRASIARSVRSRSRSRSHSRNRSRRGSVVAPARTRTNPNPREEVTDDRERETIIIGRRQQRQQQNPRPPPTPPAPPQARSQTRQPTEAEASNTGRPRRRETTMREETLRQSRGGGGEPRRRVEYEVLYPGRTEVEMEDYRYNNNNNDDDEDSDGRDRDRDRRGTMRRSGGGRNSRGPEY